MTTAVLNDRSEKTANLTDFHDVEPHPSVTTRKGIAKGQLLIDGKWRDSSSGETMTTTDPTTEAPITTVAKATPKDAQAAIDAAYAAFEEGPWGKMHHEERAKILFRMADLMGGYFGEPIDVVRCETVDLQVPATAEIVVEGYLSNVETGLEGSMGEYAGYLWPGPPSQKPLYTVTAITHRNDAVLPISVAGEPPEENHTAWGIPNAAEIVYTLRKAGLPIATAWSPFASANHWFILAVERGWRKALNVNTSDLCRRIGDVLFAGKAGMGTPKYIVVNDEIDVTDLNEVVSAFATSNHPGSQGEIVFNEESTNPLVAFLDEAEEMSMHTTKVIYNCMPPDRWGDKLPLRSSFAGVYLAALQQQVLQRWESYGFLPIQPRSR